MGFTRRTPLRILLATVSAASLLAGIAACEGPGAPIDTSGGGVDVADVTFATGVYPALAAEGCGNVGACHDDVAPGDGLELPGPGAVLTVPEAYAEIMAGGLEGPAVIPSNAAGSLLLLKGANEATLNHTGGALWSESDDTYQVVAAWITSGALNN